MDRSAVCEPKTPDASLIFNVATFALSASGNAFIAVMNFASFPEFISKAMLVVKSNVMSPADRVPSNVRTYPNQ